MSYHRVNEVPNVDTSVYRRTIWNTVQSYFGIFHDDFDYERIGIFVTDKQRVFLKRCATRPYEIGVKQERYSYTSLMPVFNASEVVHVMLMMMEARRQACLLYATRAIYKFRLSPF
ncbi:Sestrin-1 [Cichlidogyrus casuarinus]|uniref:Sestrin-1 n=1 Tax=Cichlidogyrus casuarinus TaxID=1844966 RepID=A0ABD2QBE9_9PLAT